MRLSASLLLSKDRISDSLIELRSVMKIDKRIILLILFVLVSLLCPMAMSPISDDVIIGYAFLTPILVYDYGGLAEGLTIFTGIEYWSVYLPLVAPLSFLFTIQVFRSIMGMTPEKQVFRVGVLSLIFPGLFLTWMHIPFFFMGLFGYAGPVPIQFILGMRLVSKYGHYVEELDWSDEKN